MRMCLVILTWSLLAPNANADDLAVKELKRLAAGATDGWSKLRDACPEAVRIRTDFPPRDPQFVTVKVDWRRDLGLVLRDRENDVDIKLSNPRYHFRVGRSDGEDFALMSGGPVEGMDGLRPPFTYVSDAGLNFTSTYCLCFRVEDILTNDGFVLREASKSGDLLTGEFDIRRGSWSGYRLSLTLNSVKDYRIESYLIDGELGGEEHTNTFSSDNNQVTEFKIRRWSNSSDDEDMLRFTFEPLEEDVADEEEFYCEFYGIPESAILPPAPSSIPIRGLLLGFGVVSVAVGFWLRFRRGEA